MSEAGRKILFISHDSCRTGAPIGLLAFMRWLKASTSYEIATILRTPGPLEPEFRALGPTLTLGQTFLHRSPLGRRLRRRLPARLSDEMGKVRRMAARGGYDLIYSNTITNGAVLEALAPLGVPVVTHVHELAYWISRSGPENFRRVTAATREYIAASGAVRDNLVRHHSLPADKITVVYEHIRELPAVPTAAQRATARQRLGIPAGAVVVGGCGAEHWRKGRDLIPQLLLALRKQSPQRDFHFLWVGRPGTAEEESTLRHDLNAAGVAAQFHTSGELSNPFEAFPAIDIFALLSRDDPYPLACLEVAATEIPVVCFLDAGGIPEFVADGCGFAAPYLDLPAMAADIDRLAQDRTLARTCGRRAREKVARENLVETTGRQILGVIESLLPAGRPAAIAAKNSSRAYATP